MNPPCLGSQLHPDGRRFAGLGPCALALAAACVFTVAIPAVARSQVAPAAATIDSTVEAGETDTDQPSRRFVKWNQYDGPISTVRFGYAFALDFAGYSQDSASQQQFAMSSDVAVRDFRILLSGRFKTQRPISWCFGYMYDGAEDLWRIRKTGFMVNVPELSGRFFVGRDKEGYSMMKVMNGYHIFGIERSQVQDGFIPILADGVRYMGYSPKRRVFANLGYFWDKLTEKQAFAIFDHQLVARVGGTPILSDADKTVLHLGVMARSAKPDDGQLRLKSKPGATLAPNFLDTGKFPSDGTSTWGLEAYYRCGPWIYGGEYNWLQANVAGAADARFHGGDATVVWLATGETRSYNAPGGYFNPVIPDKSVFEGGPGAVEATLTVTYSDFEDGAIQGGKFWRITPMVKWFLNADLWFEAAYGYGDLDRFGLRGKTQFFQGRIVSLL